MTLLKPKISDFNVCVLWDGAGVPAIWQCGEEGKRESAKAGGGKE